MVFDIDSFIFIAFLVINLFFGLRLSRGIKTIKQYAIGDRDFSTGTVATTLIATWICGEFFFSLLTETYDHGLYYISAALGSALSYFLVGRYFIPRMGEFLGSTSIAEAMGSIYGQNVRVITAIVGFIWVGGIVAIQLKVAGFLFEYIFHLKYFWGVIIAGFIVTLYSALGGIKSVVFTDIIQFYTFASMLPLLTLILFFEVGDIDVIINFLQTDANYDLKQIFRIDNKKSYYYLFLTLYTIYPAIDPAIFQRISMSRNLKSAQQAFYIMAAVILFLTLIIAWFGVVMKVYNPNIASSDFLTTLLDMIPPIYKGLFLIGITAAVMSTVDSYINSSAVLITHDFLNVFTKLKNELLTARIVSGLLGVFGIMLAMKKTSFVKLFLLTSSFYMAILVVPFTMTVIGYRTPYSKAVLWGMVAGFVANVAWKLCDIEFIESIIPAMIANFVVLVLMHKYYHSKEQNNIHKKLDVV